jgi:transcriptional regulator with XRE-family HTH domain
MYPNDDINQIQKKFRDKKLLQCELAKKAGCTEQAVSRWFKGLLNSENIRLHCQKMIDEVT